MEKQSEFSPAIRESLKKLPKDSGVYRFLDEKGELLYIGKAINLKNRVRNYFQKNIQSSPKTKKMVKKIAKIEWTSTRSEGEALILEANLIHTHKPPFNILLRDDKNFLYLRISKEAFPRVEFSRRFERDGAIYFGPYAKANSLRKTVEFLREILQFRTCKVDISPEGKTIRNPENRKIPCLDHQIHRCTAPCNASVSLEFYNQNIQAMIRFLRGHTAEMKKLLKEEMFQSAEKKEFERAARFRDLLQHAEMFESAQVATVSQDFSADVIAVSFGAEKSFFHVLFIRNGKILRTENFSLENAETTKETFSVFLRDYFSLIPEAPSAVLVPDMLSEEELFGWEFFAETIFSKKVEIRIPQRGTGRELLELAQKNADLQAVNSRASFEKRDVLDLLQNSLSLKNRPERIECYDISHLSGTHPVGSQVVFLDGKPAKSEYRKYKIKTLPEGKIDDFMAMAELLGRRLKHLSNSENILKMKKMKKKEMEKVAPEQKIETYAKAQQKYIFEEIASQKTVGYAQIEKIGKNALIGSLITTPEFQGKDIETEMLKILLLKSEEKMIRIFLPKKDIRFQFSLKTIGFSEEKKPTKAFQKIIDENSEKEMIVLKALPEELRKATKKIPDLLVIDGGKGQLSAVVKVLKKLKLFEKIPVCSLAKREEEIFVPEKQNPLPIPKNSPENQLLQQIRDEAHRFAIGFNKHLRKKAETSSALDEMNGIGRKTKKELLKTFGSPSAIFSASDKELLKIIPQKIIEAIRNS